MPRSSALQNRSGAVSGRSEPWRRTLTPLAHSAKAHPPQSLLSERRPDTAEPRYAAFLQNASVLALPYPGFHPGLVCSAPLGYSKSDQPGRAEPAQNRSGAVSGRSEPWRRTLPPLAHSAKAHPPQSLPSERRPDAAEPRYRGANARDRSHDPPGGPDGYPGRCIP